MAGAPDVAGAGVAALDTANTAFTETVPLITDTSSGMLETGAQASSMAPPSWSPSADPSALVDEPSGEYGFDPQLAGEAPAGPSLPPSPAQQFREAVGALPGKWYEQFKQAPTNFVNAAANNPLKTGMALATIGGTIANATKGQPDAPSQDTAMGLPPRPMTPRPGPDRELPKSGPPSSPLLAGRSAPRVTGRGGMGVM